MTAKIPTARRTELPLDYATPKFPQGLPKNVILKSLIGSAIAALAAVTGVAGLFLIGFDAPWQVAVPMVLVILFGPSAINSAIITNYVKKNYPASNRVAWNQHLMLQVVNHVATVGTAIMIVGRFVHD